MQPFGFLAYGPRFTADRYNSVTHVLCLHHLGGPYCRTRSIFKYEKLLRMRCVSGVMYE